MINVLALSSEGHGSNQTIKLVQVASPLSTQHSGERPEKQQIPIL
jgi:hypothetical protein